LLGDTNSCPILGFSSIELEVLLDFPKVSLKVIQAGRDDAMDFIEVHFRIEMHDTVSEASHRAKRIRNLGGKHPAAFQQVERLRIAGRDAQRIGRANAGPDLDGGFNGPLQGMKHGVLALAVPP
jgi:hypothetical protein